MNTRENAYTQIVEFIHSDDKGLLLTGTHQYEKHPLVLKAIATTVKSKSSILFRANSMQNLGTIFENNKMRFQTGTGYQLGNHKLYIDTFNRSSWSNTKQEYDFAVLYPVDALLRDTKLYARILSDLYDDREIKKIFFISWTDHDSYNYRQLNEDHYIQKHVAFDAEEEQPDYHQRVLERF